MMKTLYILPTLLWALMPTTIPSFNLSLAFPYAIEQHSLADGQAISCESHPTETQLAFCDHEVKTKIPEFAREITNFIEADNQYRIKTVVIDPGHGGKDSGCRGAHSREKHIALSIAKKLGTVIEVAYPTIRVIYTRTVDKFVPLHERAAIANRNQADLFISIHCNYFPKGSYVHGSETYVMGLHTANENLEVAKRENASIFLEENYQKHYDYDPNSTEGHIMLSMFQNAFLEHSILFAEKVEHHIHSHARRKSRGVKQAGFLVLRETTMPSVLIEAGFLSNAKDEGFLRQEQGQTRMANAIFSAFRAYKNEVEETPRYVVQAVQPRAYAELSPMTVPDEFQRKSANNTTKTLSTSKESITINIPVSEPTARQSTTSYSYTTPKTNTPPSTPRSTHRTTTYQAPSQPNTTRTKSARSAQSAKTYQDPFASNGTPSQHRIQYCLQLAASTKPLNIKKGRWRNVPYYIEVVREGGYYKYQVRNFASLKDANRLQQQLKTKGFKDSFVVAYQGGTKMSLNQAKRTLGR